jgi:CHAT domain-containing protein/Tfp pilus assembly protein PilF
LLTAAPSEQVFGDHPGLTRQSIKQPRDAANGTDDKKDIRSLEPGEPVKREMAGGQQHTYLVKLNADQFLKAIVEQDGIDIIVQVSGPDGKTVMEFDSESSLHGQEEVRLVAEKTGDYQLIVRPQLGRVSAASYQIRIVELRAAADSDRALQDAHKLYGESTKLLDAGKDDEALPLLERALEIRENILEPNHRDIAFTLNNLARFYLNKCRYAKAESLLQRSLVIKEKVMGPEHPSVANSLVSLATLYRMRSEYVKAEPMFERALSIYQNAFGEEHPNVGVAFNNLAILYCEKGDYAKAEPLLQRALVIKEKVVGPEHQLVASSLNNLALFYYNKGDYAKAEPLFQRALSIWQKTLGPDHKAVAFALSSLARLYKSKGEYAKAEALFERALAIGEKSLGPEHYAIAELLSGLADLYRRRGDYAKAEPLYGQALALVEKVKGTEHPEVTEFLNGLALLYAAKGDITRAVAFRARANAVSERNLALHLAYGSERQKLAYLALFAKETDITLSLHSQIAPDDPQALDLAFTTLLRRKGRGLDVMTDTISTLRRHATLEDKSLLDQLAEARLQLATFVLRESGASKPNTYQTQLKLLESEVEELEAKISSRSAEFRIQAQPVMLGAVQAVLPANSALVEFAVYTPQELRTEKELPPRYLAYILPARGQPRRVELCDAATIDHAVDAWRRALRDPNRTDVNRLARAVDEKVMRPVRSLLGRMPGETHQLFIAPDGLLNLIPFATMVDERNQYLIERYSISYLTSGRDLLRLGASPPSKNAPLVMANPIFGRVETLGAQARQNSGNSQVDSQVWGQIDPTAIFFQSLPGTEREALAIKALLPEAAVLLREQATETALKQSRAPRVLHIATHGFFLIDEAAPAAEIRGVSDDNPLRLPIGLSKRAAKIDNPLLRSGLALAGANEHRSGDDDGVLTSLEAASLDLWGTRLVVLSGCATGVGEVKNGEGVFGLRRALVLAGAETQVMSLWPVWDEETPSLMASYYRRLLKGEGRGEALRQVQLEMLKDAKLRHPHYWGNFIQSGEWANLDGQR